MRWGAGPVLVVPPTWIGHLELQWDDLGMRDFYARLATHYELVFYDKRGTGLSEREREDFSLASELEDVEAVVDEVTRGPVALFGSSLGAPLSVAYTVAHPERVTHLVLYGAYAEGSRVATPEVRASLTALLRASWGIGAEVMASIFMRSEEDPAFHARLRRFQREAASGAIAAQLLDSVYTWDVGDLLPKLHVPTLVIHRRHDRAIRSRLGVDLASRIAGARLALLEGDIHCPWLGDWQSIADLIEGFVPPARAVTPPQREGPLRFETVQFAVQDAAELARVRVGVAQVGEQDDVFTPGANGLFRLPATRVAHVQRKLERVVGDAADQGVNLLVFPEMTIDLNFGELEAELRELAARHGMYLVAGGYHDEVTRANVCKVIGPDGPVWQQRKHIPATFTLAGNQIREAIDAPAPHVSVIATTRFGRVAIAICRDFLDLDLLVELKNAEPPIDILINPAFTPVTADFTAAHVGARRALYACTVFCNHAAFGDSEIFSPEKRKRRVHVAPGREAVVHRDVPLMELRAERRAWDERAHRRFIQSTRSA